MNGSKTSNYREPHILNKEETSKFFSALSQLKKMKEQQKPNPIILKKLKEISHNYNEINIIIPTEQEDEVVDGNNKDSFNKETVIVNKVLNEIWEELGEYNAGGLKFDRMWSETKVNPILILTVLP